MINLDKCYYIKTINTLQKVILIVAEFLMCVLALQALLVTTGTGMIFAKHLRKTHTHTYIYIMSNMLNNTDFSHLLHTYVTLNLR